MELEIKKFIDLNSHIIFWTVLQIQKAPIPS